MQSLKGSVVLSTFLFQLAGRVASPALFPHFSRDFPPHLHYN
jgi:hypothetical protein